MADDYGSGSDEALNRTVGSRSLKAYRNLEGFEDYMETGELLAHHGPSYFMVFVAFSRFVTSVFPTWHTVDGLHLANYLTFLLGVAMFYSLGQRLLPRNIAWLTTALFATQPVLFGAGFINQKDMPFMVFFMATLVAGIWVAQRFEASSASTTANGSSDGSSPIWQSIRRDWELAQPRWKIAIVALAVLFIWVVLDSLVFDSLLLALKSLLALAYSARDWEPINRLFAIADDDGIKNLGNGLRIAGARAACDDKGMRTIALGSPEGNAGKIQNGEDIRIIQLV